MVNTFREALGPDGSRLVACIDPDAQFTKPKLARSRLGAVLAPFPSDEAAEAAFKEAMAKGAADD